MSLKHSSRRPIQPAPVDPEVSDNTGPTFGAVMAREPEPESPIKDESLDRYHELVDQRLAGRLTAEQRLELEHLEILLDAQDVDLKLEARNQQWTEERAALLNSIEDLLIRLRR